MSKSFNFSAINLGCSKNMVDLEYAIGEILKYSDRAPIEFVEDPEDSHADYVIVNTDIDKAFNELLTILQAERMRRDRQPGLAEFVRGLNKEFDAR